MISRILPFFSPLIQTRAVASPVRSLQIYGMAMSGVLLGTKKAAPPGFPNDAAILTSDF